MICILLVAGHGTLLESHIKNDQSGLYSFLEDVPKALLPGVGGKKILDFWWKVVNTRQLFSEVYLVTNADKYKHYERWATANNFPVENIINDGTTTYEMRLGAVADLELAISSKKISDDIMVIAGDMLCADQNFDIAQVLKFFKLKSGELAIYYELEDGECNSSRGIVEVCPDTHRITQFLEKPKPGVTSSRLASVVFYCFRRQTLSTLETFLNDYPSTEDRVLGRYMEWLINISKVPVFGMKLPTGFQLIGQVGLPDYTKWLAHYSTMKSEPRVKSITCRSYARIGIIGNPSDGYYGKTISMSISNFWAEVTIAESKKLVLVPHPLNDPTEFGSLLDLFYISRKEGYLGGLRLLQATCKKFYQYCSEKGIALSKQNFTLKYNVNIPRQVGLAGSRLAQDLTMLPGRGAWITGLQSAPIAIVSATLKGLMKFYNLTDDDLPKTVQPNFILDVEKEELFITAGLQDRVVQVYEGLIYMDFSRPIMEEQGFGDYVCMDIGCAPPFWLAYLRDPSDSGVIHNNVRQRWLSGDPEVTEAMKIFAELTDKAKAAIEQKNWTELAKLMDQNLELRRSIFTDACLGPGNLQMIEIAKQHGCAVKLPGSGGAVIGLCFDAKKLVELKKSYQEAGFVFCQLSPYCPGGV
ncbi:probable glucuronokinase 2 isoform X2 [Rana temporaria]|uniref:probable glucuronokinase 2 isoform X2 n=1 Tax=Rana temporaria TaxID=8407 RepID=UPI001AADDA70|nr:probable glucuronokinase 2 isoform X2 [Rana temporaria]XP_040182064.1 probable glucuronokinase 2 isoform X2 [Rana temporaria]